MKTKKINIFIIIAIFMILIVCGFVIYKTFFNHNANFTNDNKQDTVTNEYKIRYKSGNYIYDITKRQGNIITVVKSEDTMCDALICAQVVLEKNTLILDSEENMNVSQLFEQLFIDTDEKEVIVSDSELIDSQLNVINNIIKKDIKVEEDNNRIIINDNNKIDNNGDNNVPNSGNNSSNDRVIVNDRSKRDNAVIEDSLEPNTSSNNNNNSSLSYEILGSNQRCSVYNRGYIEEDTNQGYLVTIAAGAKNTGGYNISISSVNINGDKVIIYVNETSPKANESVIQVLTQPCVSIRFNKKPNNLTIKNMKTGEIFKKTFKGKEEDVSY